MAEPIIISLGGAVFAKDGLDTKFLKGFRKIILKRARKRRFFIYVGGGRTARDYQKALKSLSKNEKERDWVGIYATRLNAQLLRLAFGRAAEEEIITNPTKKVKTRKNIVLAAGWKPGWSTDYDAVLLAENVGARLVVNLTNVDYVYDRDPRKFKNAKPFKELSWLQFKKVIGGKWEPGLHAPFDPVAAEAAARAKIKVAVLNGGKLANFENFLDGKRFRGTVIGR